MLEVCVDTIQAAILAEQSGADRIELCSALDLGGVTPSGALISAVRRAIQSPLIVLIRSRTGDFLFDSIDRALMLEEAKQAVDLGADGVAIGGLTPSSQLDLPFLQSVATALPDVQLVMHRAFDLVCDPTQAMEQLVDLGFTRILTSGGASCAVDGTRLLRSLHEQSRGRIQILPAGGVSDVNALEILHKTLASQLHGSFRNVALENRIDPTSVAITKAILTAFQSHADKAPP